MSIRSVSWLVCTLAVGSALAADTPGSDTPHDPTNPADAAAKSGDASTGDTPLAGPDVQSDPDTGGRRGMGRDRGGPMMNAGNSVQSLLANRCGSCHGASKQKGGVQMVPLDRLFEGDSRDWVVIPGKPDQSILLTRVSFPAGHEDIMPPKDPPLTAKEVTMIRDWIAGGNSATKLIGSAGGNEGKEGGRVDPRTWGAVYLSLDLTPTQRRAASTAIQKLQKEMGAMRKRPKSASGEQRPAPSPEDRTKREQLQQRIAETQDSLWTALTEAQQTSMRAILEDPAAIATIRKAQRGRRGAGRRGGDRPRPPRD